jgi:hypothetical protein
MPSHHWDDKDFDWKALYSAESYGAKFMKRWGRIGIHSKEKYGTIRWSVYFFDGSLHSLIYPGYVYNQFPKWLWVLDCNRYLRFLCPIICRYQAFIVRAAFKNMCNKWSHIVKEILCDAPENILPADLEKIRSSMWVKY